MVVVFDFNGVHNDDDKVVFDVIFFPTGTFPGFCSLEESNKGTVTAPTGCNSGGPPEMRTVWVDSRSQLISVVVVVAFDGEYDSDKLSLSKEVSACSRDIIAG